MSVERLHSLITSKRELWGQPPDSQPSGHICTAATLSSMVGGWNAIDKCCVTVSLCWGDAQRKVCTDVGAKCPRLQVVCYSMHSEVARKKHEGDGLPKRRQVNGGARSCILLISIQRGIRHPARTHTVLCQRRNRLAGCSVFANSREH